jgi:Uma2 family endonuclease
MGKQPLANEQKILLQNVSWQQYEQLLAEVGPRRTSRFTYDRGRLELMTPLEEHERYHKLIESMILVVADEQRLSIEGYKVPILKRHDLQIGTEPDTAYYLQNAAQMQGKQTVDLDRDPPPNLILEVELSKGTLNKAEIYAALGIREVWRYVSKPGENFLKGQFFIHAWEGDRYVEQSQSLAFPQLSVSKILQFIDQSDAIGLMSALRSLREWLQES